MCVFEVCLEDSSLRSEVQCMVTQEQVLTHICNEKLRLSHLRVASYSNYGQIPQAVSETSLCTSLWLP